jgi:formate hydrogenlyase subunit 6/NADH:ubiquinone oxidoreductase subunit I
MKRNIIFYFSGTGNSLKVAKNIASILKYCDVVSMDKPYMISGTYERIGFVFPCYAQGMPLITTRFIGSLNLSENKNAYYFAVVTCGANPGNCIAQTDKLLKAKGISLHYGNTIKMFANCITLYKMANNPKERAEKSDRESQMIAANVLTKAATPIPKSKPLLAFLYKSVVPGYAKKAKEYRISDGCTSCKTCANICPVDNITFSETKSYHPGAPRRPGLPIFGDQCEQCMACIQWCPQLAIDYKQKTQRSRRYHHPDITVDEMIAGKIV